MTPVSIAAWEHDADVDLEARRRLRVSGEDRRKRH
jgi:hypothetical protein